MRIGRLTNKKGSQHRRQNELDDDKARLGMAWRAKAWRGKPRHGKDRGCGESRTPLFPELEVSMSDRVTVTAEQLVAEYGWPESTAALFVPGGETRTFPRVFVEKPPDGEWVLEKMADMLIQQKSGSPSSGFFDELFGSQNIPRDD